MTSDRAGLSKKERDGTGVTEALSLFASGLEFETLPDTVRHQSKRCLLDTLAAILGGCDEKTPAVLKEICRRDTSSVDATVVASGFKTSGTNAALLNGAMAHALELDDGHRFAAGHPGAVVVPAALAAGELKDADGRELAAGVVAGYEVFIRVGAAINPGHLRRGFHTTGTCGPLGAAAAAGRIFRLTPAQMENALGLAALQGAGLLKVVDSGAEAKPFQVGKASESGLLAALLASRGMEGPKSVLEGHNGFVGAFTGRCDYDVFVDGLGRKFRMLETYVKLYPTCRHIHGVLDAIFEFKSRGQRVLKPSEIREITVETYDAAVDLTGRIHEPTSVEQARFSLPYAAAVALLVEDQVEFPAEFQGNLHDPATLGLANKVHASVVERWERVYPAIRGATIALTMTDGSRAEQVVEVPRGEPENPAGDELLEAKFAAFARSKVADGTIVRQIMSLERLAKVSNLMRLVS